MPTMLAANHPGAVALAAGELAEHSAGPATIAPRAVVKRSMTLLALHLVHPSLR